MLLLLVALAVPTTVGAQAGPTPTYQPDGDVGRSGEARTLGQGIVNDTAARQTLASVVADQGVTSFVVRATNAGSVPDDIFVTGARNTPEFLVSYVVGERDVSARVRAGVFRFADVAVGAQRTLTVTITARAAAEVGDRVEATVSLRSAADPAAVDTVEALVIRARRAATAILGGHRAKVRAAEAWARRHEADPEFVANARLYWELAATRGIRPEVAYAQSAKETGFGHFGGVIDATFHNPCGLKTTTGGDDADPDAHQRFDSWSDGVTACLDHLALYAGAPGYPRADSLDPRHFPFLSGIASSVERLGAAWAPAPDYGLSLVRDFLTGMVKS